MSSLYDPIIPLLDRAECEFVRDGVVAADTQALLAAEGYELSRLDAYLEKRTQEGLLYLAS